MKTKVVYLVHLDEKLSNHAGHYLGSADNLLARLNHHFNGSGARMLRAAKAKGIGWTLVRIWKGDRTFERKLKNLKHANRLCPICNAKVAHELVAEPLRFVVAGSE